MSTKKRRTENVQPEAITSMTQTTATENFNATLDNIAKQLYVGIQKSGNVYIGIPEATVNYIANDLERHIAEQSYVSLQKAGNVYMGIQEGKVKDAADALDKLAGLSFNDERRKIATSMGVPGLVITALQLHEDLVEKGLTCLDMLLCPNNVTNILYSGGLDAVIISMSILGPYPQGREEALALKVLHTLFTANGETPAFVLDGAKTRFVNKLAGISFIVKIMKKRASNGGIQGGACKLLCSLTNKKELRTKLLKGAVGAVGTAVGSHEGSNAIVKKYGNDFFKMCSSSG